MGAGNRTRLGRKELKRWLNEKKLNRLAENIRKTAHVPAPELKDEHKQPFGGWFSWLEEIKTIIRVVMVMLAGRVLSLASCPS